MRVIKFRAWEVPSQQMFDLDPEAQAFSEEKHQTLLSALYSPDDEWIVMQYTGIKDALDNDIYEGDILRIPAKDKYDEYTYNCFEVFYHDNECIGGFNVGFCMNRMHSHGHSAGGRGYKFTPESIKENGFIISGNIYENPELLK